MCAKFHQHRLKHVTSRPELTDRQTYIQTSDERKNSLSRRIEVIELVRPANMHRDIVVNCVVNFPFTRSLKLGSIGEMRSQRSRALTLPPLHTVQVQGKGGLNMYEIYLDLRDFFNAFTPRN